MSDSVNDKMNQAIANKAQATKIDAGRNRRPFGSLAQKLHYAQREGYHRHWFNDSPGRIQRALDASYTHVLENGKPVSRPVDVAPGGGALMGFLMEIPKEWWEADQKEVQDRIKEQEEGIIRGEADVERGLAV